MPQEHSKREISTKHLNAASSPSYGSTINKVENPMMKSPLASEDEPTVVAVYDSVRARRRRDLMLDDQVLEYVSIEGRRYSLLRQLIYYVLSLLTGGTVYIIANWPFMRLITANWLSKKAKHAEADFMFVTAADKSREMCPIEQVARTPLALLHGSARRSQYARPSSIPLQQRMFIFRHTRFLYNNDTESYRQIDLENDTKQLNLERGRQMGEVSTLLQKCGQNVIDIPIPPWYILLFRECIHPFVIFQIWAVVVWLTEAYWTFSAFIFVAALATAFMNFWEVRKNLLDIQSLSKYTTTVQVIRDGAIMTMVGYAALSLPSTELVPGDLMIVESDTKLPCDCVLVRGQCTVNEAMLTGETTVVIKHPVSGADSINGADARNTLFGGSLVVQLRVKQQERVIAAVVRTGFESVKGRLVLSILYPKVPRFKFLEQSLMFVGVLFLLAMAGFGVNAKALSTFDTPIDKIVQRGCDMVTIVVPPALPLALTVGIAYALIALRKDKIFCISPPRVNLAGKINCFCFDKTGTLTTEGLEFSCIRPTRGANFGAAVTTFGDLSGMFGVLLATCHSLTHVKEVLSGDPLELQTFAFSGATLEEPHTSSRVPAHALGIVSWPQDKPQAGEFAVLKQFEFVPALQRMSCLVANQDGHHFAVVKGSPEMIHQLCTADTLPADYMSVLDEYTYRGFRVLGAAYKPMPQGDYRDVHVDTLRKDVEQNLTFLGFIVLENRLKPETTPVIQRLRNEAGISMHMVTGDNVVAAVCVARNCTIVENGYRVFVGDVSGPSGDGQIIWKNVDDNSITLDPHTLVPSDGSAHSAYRLAMTGKAYMQLLDAVKFGQLDRSHFQKMILNCTVFARMSPENKASLVEQLQETGMYVGMTGDGANDSLALRAAHVGISLSQVEASVSAPFTSMQPNISCVPRVLCEGRGSLATSFCLFQFMALYSTIQFANALLIVFSNSFLSNNEYLYQDLFVVFILALTLGSTPSSRVLTLKRPSANLLSLYNLTICFGFIIITLVMQGIVFLRVREQSWYDTPEFPASMNPDDDEEGTNSKIPETTTVFLIAMLQYVAVAIIFSIGYPWKLATYRNYVFSGWLAVVFGVSMFIYLKPTTAIYDFIALQIMPESWHLEVFAWSWASFVAYFIFVGVAYSLRRRGFFSWLSRNACGRCSTRVAVHKRLRGEWARQFNVKRLGELSSSNPMANEWGISMIRNPAHKAAPSHSFSPLSPGTGFQAMATE